GAPAADGSAARLPAADERHLRAVQRHPHITDAAGLDGLAVLAAVVHAVQAGGAIHRAAVNDAVAAGGQLGVALRAGVARNAADAEVGVVGIEFERLALVVSLLFGVLAVLRAGLRFGFFVAGRRGC